MGSPGIFHRPTRTESSSFSSACSFQAAHRLSDSMNRGFSFPCHTSGPMKKILSRNFPVMYLPVSTRRYISLPLYYILPSWTRRYNRGLINLLPYNILKLFLVCECKSTHYSLKNNTLCEKYELRRGKKRCLTMKKNIPLHMQSSMYKGIESPL